MKACFKCGRELPLTDFYVHPQMADGHLNKCKDCAKADVRVRYCSCRRDPEWRQLERRRGRSKYHRLYKGRKSSRAPEKRRANNAVNNAVRDGRLMKPDSCSRCGGNEVGIEGHHMDYSSPLDVTWLCSTCHGKEHRSY